MKYLERWDIARIDAPIRTSKDRQTGGKTNRDVSLSFSVSLMFLCPRLLDLLASLSFFICVSFDFFLSFCIRVLLSSNNNTLRGKICTRVLSDQNNFIFRHTIVDCKMFMISGKEELARYICTICPDDREMPGFEGVVAKWDRNKHGE